MAVRTTFIILALLLSAASVAVSGQVLVTGSASMAVVRSDGTLWTCGKNSNGNLGDGSKAHKGTFVQVMDGAQGAAMGTNHVAALRSDGTVWTAGYNGYSSLGDGAVGVDRTTFKEVLTGGQAVDAGYYHTAVLRSDGTVWTAGWGQYGQLGDGGNTDRDTFVEVLAGAQAVCLGESNTAALLSDGTLVIAGQDNHGQLGDGGGHADRNTFTEYFPGESVQAMGLHTYMTAVLKSDGTVWTAGLDTHGQLGDGGGNTDRDTFMQVLDGAQSIAQGNGYALAVVKSDGTLWTAGWNDMGMLGDGGNTDRDTLAQVLDGAQAAAVGGKVMAVLLSDGSVWTAGQDNMGQLGDGGSATGALGTERSTFKKVIDGVFPPTAAPTPPPTPSPTAPPTTASTAGTNGGSTSAKGDPHLQNINGQRFDLMRPGKHVLLHIPRGAEAPHVLLRVEAEVQRLGAQCGETYFQHINVTGAWVKGGHDGILQFHADDVGGEEEAAWMSFGAVSLKVVHAQHRGGIRYLNIYAKHLGRVQFKIGGLLGEDDHEYEATPDEDCIPKISFFSRSPRGDPPSTPAPLSAEASLA